MFKDVPNLIELDIDIEALKKYNPNIRVLNEQDLTNVAEKLPKVVNLDKGEIEIDASKINPQCI